MVHNNYYSGNTKGNKIILPKEDDSMFKTIMRFLTFNPPILCKKCGNYTYPDSIGCCRYCNSKLDL